MIQRHISAASIARLAHAGQVDHAGEDYFEGHLTRVAATLEFSGLKTIALLHDIFEDTITRVLDLKNLRVNDRVIRAILVLTRRENEVYNAYIDRVANSGDHLAVAVKIADLNDHLRDTTHISASLVKRYERALEILKMV